MDFYLPFPKNDSGFYDVARTVSFFKEVTTEGRRRGLVFRALYNDPEVARRVNRWAGEHVVGFQWEHGPHPFKLHIHFDIFSSEAGSDAYRGSMVK